MVELLSTAIKTDSRGHENSTSPGRATDGRKLDLTPVARFPGDVPRAPKRAPRRPPRQKRSEETIAVLLEATERVFARDGFAQATTNRIAEVAGVSIGTLYHYFPTKESLVEALVHRMWAAELRLLFERAVVLDGPLPDAIRALVHALCEAVAQRDVIVRRWYAEAPHLGRVEFGLELADQATAMVRVALEHRRDQVRPRDLPFAADFVVKMALAAVRTAARDWPAQLQSGQLEDEVTDLLTRYLVKP
jgi:AcrR family transcriptional regulator